MKRRASGVTVAYMAAPSSACDLRFDSWGVHNLLASYEVHLYMVLATNLLLLLRACTAHSLLGHLQAQSKHRFHNIAMALARDPIRCYEMEA